MFQDAKRKIDCRIGSTPQSGNLWGMGPMTKITSRWSLTLVWNLKKILLLLCRALRSMTDEGNLRPLQPQLMSVGLIQEHAGACRTVKRQHMDHFAEKTFVESFHYGLVHKPVSIQEAMKIPEAKTAVDKEWNQVTRTIPAWDVKKVWSHPSGEEGWKIDSLCEFDGPLSLEERRTGKTPPEIHGASCALEWQRQRRRRIQSSIHGARCFSVSDGNGKTIWTLSQSFLVRLEKQVTQYQRTHKSKWLKLPDCYECRKKNVLRFGSEFLYDKDQTVGNTIADPVVPLARNFFSHPLASFLWERNVEEATVEKEREKVPTWNVFTCRRSSDCSYRYMWTISRRLERKKTIHRMWDKLCRKKSTLKIQRHH